MNIYILRDNEKYININGEQTHYTIDTNGTVVNTKTCKEVKGGISGKGYLGVDLYINGKGYHKYKHRLVAEAFIENPYNYTEVNHIDGNKKNNFIDNLEWCSRSMNNKHAYDTGLKSKGEKCSFSKYDEKSIKIVCKMLEDGIPPSQISKKTSVNVSVIFNILYLGHWKEISEKYNIDKNNFSHYTVFDKKTRESIRYIGSMGITSPKKICELLNIEVTKQHRESIYNILKSMKKGSTTNEKHGIMLHIDI